MQEPKLANFQKNGERKKAMMASQGGQFNYALKHTGFLGETKMRARRISQNPKQFLEMHAEKNLEFVPLECPQLDGFIENLKAETRFSAKEADMLERKELTKRRTFLLNLASSPINADFGTDLEYLHKNEESRDVKKLDKMVEKYLEQIKQKDLAPIETWIFTPITMTDASLSLPYGLPKELKIPLDLNDVQKAQHLDDGVIDFIESTSDDFLLMDGEYHTKLQDIVKKLQANQEQILNPAWSLQETALLSHIIDAVGESNSPASIALQNELTSRLFLDKAREEIIAQKYRLKTKRHLESKQASIIRDWGKDKEDLQRKVNMAWQEMSKKRVARLEQIINRKKQENICLRWSQEVEKQRKAKCDKIRRLEITIEPVERKRSERLKLIRDKEEYRKAVVKLEATKYHEKKVLEKISKIKEQESVTNMLREIEKIQAIKNKTRVDFRTERLQIRSTERNDNKIAMEKNRQLRKSLLESTKEPVVINYDPCSVISDTHASAVRRFQTLNISNPEEEEMVKFFREKYSFSAETILKDRRNRVEAKLREVGLLESSYARQVLLAMEPKAKPHLQTQIKFEYEQSN